MQKLILAALLGCLVLPCGLLAAQGELARVSSGSFVDGSQSPDEIPYFAKIRGLVAYYDAVYRAGLASDLTATDAAIVDELIATQDYNRDVEARQYDDSFRALCAKSETMDAMSIDEEYSALNEAFIATEEARYRKILSRLSDSGAATVQKYLVEQVTPGIKMSSNESTEINDPEQYRFNFDLNCYLAINGEYPPGALKEPLQQDEHKLGAREPSAN